MDDKGNMSELEQVREMARQVLQKAEQGNTVELALAIEKATQALRTVSDLEKSQAEIRKLTIDEQKARYDLDHASKQEILEGRQRYIVLLTPLVTTLVLGLTLGLQTYQFVRTERDKQEAAEDAQWSEAVKTISEKAKLSPIAAALNPFLRSKRYADMARKTAMQAMANSRDQIAFSDLFKELFVPVDWGNLDAVVQIDRALGLELSHLYAKTYNTQTKHNDLSLLTVDERREYNYFKSSIAQIGEAVGSLLKGPRPAGQGLDLRSASFDSDWSGVNLYEARIDDIDLSAVDLKDADLGGITSFNGAYFWGTPWWDARRISPALLDYLIQRFPFDPSATYGLKDVRMSQQDYDNAILRLRDTK